MPVFFPMTKLIGVVQMNIKLIKVSLRLPQHCAVPKACISNKEDEEHCYVISIKCIHLLQSAWQLLIAQVKVV